MPYTTLDGKQTVPPATRFYEDEGVSGYSEWETRPGLAALLRDAGNGEFDVVRITDADRLSRSRADQGSIIDTLEELGIEVIIHSADPSSPFGMTLLRMQASIAQDERDFIGERIARAQPQGA
jgi:DNA invertase Pin-like site-specific DNA recombinase